MMQTPENKALRVGTSVERTEAPSAAPVPGAEPSGTNEAPRAPQSDAATSPSQPSGSEAIASQREAVRGRPWIKRDEHGVFRATSPAGSDPKVAEDLERFSRDLDADYPNAGLTLRDVAKRTNAMLRRLERSVESSAGMRPGARVPRALAECGLWTERLIRLLEVLEQSRRRRTTPKDPRALVEQLNRQAEANRR
jgi:hypothetical protein